MPDSYGGTPSADSYYERLGVDPEASDEAVTRASKLAKRAVHPDNNSSEQTTAEREFDRVTDAADALTDSDSRAAYNTFIDDQGSDTGTSLYEEWDVAGRPRSPTAWLSEPRSRGSSSTTSTTSASTTNTTTETAETSTTASTTKKSDRTTSRTRTGADDRPGDRRRPGEQTQASTTTRETDDTAASDGRTTTASTADATETQEAGDSASTTPTGRPNSKRAPESVLGEDPEELYSKYVLDSEAAWGPREDDSDSSHAASDGASPETSTSAVETVVSRVVSPEVAAIIGRFVAVPKPWWLRGGVAVVLLALAVVVGPIAERLALLPFVALPRIGPWLYPVLAAAVTVAPELVPLETSAAWLVAYAGLSVGYSLLGRRRRLNRKQ